MRAGGIDLSSHPAAAAQKAEAAARTGPQHGQAPADDDILEMSEVGRWWRWWCWCWCRWWWWWDAGARDVRGWTL